MPAHSKRIKDLAPSDRPLERLLAQGSEILSDNELLALLIGSGRKGKNAIQLASSLIKNNDVSSLSSSSLKTLQQEGIGQMKAARILAALELGRRVYQRSQLAITRILSIEDILTQCRDIVDKKQEYCIVLYLNARKELIKKEVLAIGTLNVMSIEPREIFRHAIVEPCAGIIICHNHPSGDPSPSDADIQFTEKLQQGGVLMGVQLLDHVIVASESYFSFRENPEE